MPPAPRYLDEAPGSLVELHRSFAAFSVFVRQEFGPAAIRREAYAALGRMLKGRPAGSDRDRDFADAGELSYAWGALTALWQDPQRRAHPYYLLRELMRIDDDFLIARMHTPKEREAYLLQLREAAELLANSPYVERLHFVDLFGRRDIERLMDALDALASKSAERGLELPFFDEGEVLTLLRQRVCGMSSDLHRFVDHVDALRSEPPLVKHINDSNASRVQFVVRRLHGWVEAKTGQPDDRAVAALAGAWCDDRVDPDRARKLRLPPVRPNPGRKSAK